MTRLKFDQFAKQYLEEFLAPFGTVERQHEVSAEPRFVDILFLPAPQLTQPPELGLLSQIAAAPCLIEPFSTAPTASEVRNCLLKLLLIESDLQRRANRQSGSPSDLALPDFWLLCPSVSAHLPMQLGAQVTAAWGAGVYILADFLQTAVVAINQLPKTEATLWLRLLGRGATQADAIAELLALDRTDPRRNLALNLLVQWRITLEITAPINQLTEEDQRAVMALSQAYAEWEQITRQQGLQQGLQQGRQTERRATLELLLRLRFGELDPPLLELLPRLVALPIETYSQLLLRLPSLSKSELIEQFREPS